MLIKGILSHLLTLENDMKLKYLVALLAFVAANLARVGIITLLRQKTLQRVLSRKNSQVLPAHLLDASKRLPTCRHRESSHADEPGFFAAYRQ